MNLDDICPGMELVADLRDGCGLFRVVVTRVFAVPDTKMTAEHPVQARRVDDQTLGLYHLDELSLP